MNSYPEQRKVTANVLTPLGWLHATMHLPPMQTLFDFLNSGQPIVKCTRVRLPNQPLLQSFVALRRDAITLVAPTIDELVETVGSVGHTRTRQVRCYLDDGILDGEFEVLINLRISDFLRQQTGLVVLRQAQLTPYDPGADPTQSRKMPVVIVNLANVVGIAEIMSS
ncbi:MAG TPA: hypothetical protein VFL95_03835 [Gemmatimonadales bacterium]|nr:hypothetical protein [Gemmatimonadales bacterium]